VLTNEIRLSYSELTQSIKTEQHLIHSGDNLTFLYKKIMNDNAPSHPYATEKTTKNVVFC
jgi:hypothetical protein